MQGSDTILAIFSRHSWVFDGDRDRFTSPDGLTSMDLQTAVQVVAEGGMDVLELFIGQGNKERGAVNG